MRARHQPEKARFNQIPRRCGRFLWRQVSNALGAGASMLFGAMFDEVDEGTAMFKVQPSAADALVAGVPARQRVRHAGCRRVPAAERLVPAPRGRRRGGAARRHPAVAGPPTAAPGPIAPVAAIITRQDSAMPLVSLGAQCYPAWLIRRMGLRDAAYPFDWLWSDPMMVVACIEDGFTTFLDRRLHETFGGEGHQSTHLVYGPRFDRRVVFNHHDITNSGIYDRYVRAVERLRALLGVSDPDNWFVVFGPPDRMTDAAFQALARCLQASGPGNSLIAVSLHAARKQRETIRPCCRTHTWSISSGSRRCNMAGHSPMRRITLHWKACS